MVKKGIVKFSKIVATFTMVLAVVSVNATCFFFSHQPDIPDSLKKRTLINVAFMVILSYYVIGYPIAFIPYIAVYTPLRLTAGGYHARSHLKCILYTQITFIVFVMSALALAKKNIWCLIVLYMVAVLTVLRLAPVEAENKPLTGEEKHKQQLNTWGFQTIILIVIVIAAIFGVLKNEIVLCVMAANISVAISLILAKIID